MHRIKIPQQDFVLKMQRGLMREGGGGVFAGHYGNFISGVRILWNTIFPRKGWGVRIISGIVRKLDL